MDFLKSNQKHDIRLNLGDIVLYEPTDIQTLDIKEMLLKQQIDMDKEEAEVDYSVVRYIIKECCLDGSFIDEYTDEQLVDSFANGNKNIKTLEKEIISIIEEVYQLIYDDNERALKMFNDMLNILNTSNDINKMKTKFNKLSKKYKWDITFDDLITNSEKLQELQNKLNKKDK